MVKKSLKGKRGNLRRSCQPRTLVLVHKGDRAAETGTRETSISANIGSRFRRVIRTAGLGRDARNA